MRCSADYRATFLPFARLVNREHEPGYSSAVSVRVGSLPTLYLGDLRYRVISRALITGEEKNAPHAISDTGPVV